MRNKATGNVESARCSSSSQLKTQEWKPQVASNLLDANASLSSLNDKQDTHLVEQLVTSHLRELAFTVMGKEAPCSTAPTKTDYPKSKKIRALLMCQQHEVSYHCM